MSLAARAAFASPDCDERKELAHALSPDRKLIAEIYLIDCGRDGIASTDIDYTIEIRSASDPPSPEPSGFIFEMAYNAKEESWLTVNWVASNKLLATIPNDALIGYISDNYAGVSTVYKYVPADDPVERRCVREWLKRSSVETIPDFVTRCRKSMPVGGPS
jgi:hypothetical protein